MGSQIPLDTACVVPVTDPGDDLACLRAAAMLALRTALEQGGSLRSSHMQAGRP